MIAALRPLAGYEEDIAEAFGELYSQLGDLNEHYLALERIRDQGEDPSAYYEDVWGELPDELAGVLSLEAGELRRWAANEEREAAALAEDITALADEAEDLERQGLTDDEIYDRLSGQRPDAVGEWLSPAEFRALARQLVAQATSAALMARLVADRVEQMERHGEDAEREIGRLRRAAQDLVHAYEQVYGGGVERALPFEVLI